MGVVAWACNFSGWKAKAGGLMQIPDQPGLGREPLKSHIIFLKSHIYEYKIAFLIEKRIDSSVLHIEKILL